MAFLAGKNKTKRVECVGIHGSRGLGSRRTSVQSCFATSTRRRRIAHTAAPSLGRTQLVSHARVKTFWTQVVLASVCAGTKIRRATATVKAPPHSSPHRQLQLITQQWRLTPVNSYAHRSVIATAAAHLRLWPPAKRQQHRKALLDVQMSRRAQATTTACQNVGWRDLLGIWYRASKARRGLRTQLQTSFHCTRSTRTLSWQRCGRGSQEGSRTRLQDQRLWL
jgi:hypothetical protein